jgi:triphosphatase
MPHEIELKIDMGASDISKLEGEIDRCRFASGRAERRRLLTIYFDTADHALHEAGISLRMRREKTGWLQTVKLGRTGSDGLSNRMELEAHVDADAPDLAAIPNKKVRQAVKKASGDGALLRPVFETSIERTTRTLDVDGSKVELAIDEGEVRAGTRRGAIREIELELKAGSPEAILVVTEALLPGQDFDFSMRSKADHGYRLALDKRGANAEPEKARPLSIGSSDTVGEGFSTIVASTGQKIRANRRALLETEDPEAPHQLRVGLRRLRSALWALRPWFDSAALAELEKLARDTGRQVGRLRDVDVMITDLLPSAHAGASDKAGFADLEASLRAHRDEIRREIRDFLRGSDWTRLELHLAVWPPTLGLNEGLNVPIADASSKMLAKAWKKARSRGDKLDKLNAEELHDLRKSFKRLRYHSEFFAGLFERRDAKQFIKRLKALHDVFGSLSDVRLARNIVELAMECKLGADALAAAAYTAGQHEAEASHNVKHAADLWKSLKRAPRFWA